MRFVRVITSSARKELGFAFPQDWDQIEKMREHGIRISTEKKGYSYIRVLPVANIRNNGNGANGNGTAK